MCTTHARMQVHAACVCWRDRVSVYTHRGIRAHMVHIYTYVRTCSTYPLMHERMHVRWTWVGRYMYFTCLLNTKNDCWRKEEKRLVECWHASARRGNCESLKKCLRYIDLLNVAFRISSSFIANKWRALFVERTVTLITKHQFVFSRSSSVHRKLRKRVSSRCRNVALQNGCQLLW